MDAQMHRRLSIEHQFIIIIYALKKNKTKNELYLIKTTTKAYNQNQNLIITLYSFYFDGFEFKWNSITKKK